MGTIANGKTKYIVTRATGGIYVLTGARGGQYFASAFIDNTEMFHAFGVRSDTRLRTRDGQIWRIPRAELEAAAQD